MSDGDTKKKPAKKAGGKSRAEAKSPAGDAAKALPVEKWFRRKKTATPIRAALMRRTRWGAGRMLSEEEFDKALGKLLKSPADGSRT